ncbi:MAG: AI-2E family transporter [Planctomycetaceae bacterium]|nr:AI-2E family transporter [Planctomycetaceae bacterium]
MDNSSNSGIISYTEQERPRSSRVSQALIITAATVIILGGIQFASGLVGPMLLALFIAVILLVPLRWLQTRGCPNFLAYPIVLFCTVALFVSVTFFVGQSLNDFIVKIPDYRDKFVEKYADLEAQVQRYIDRLVIGEIPFDNISEEPADEPAIASPAANEPDIPAQEPSSGSPAGAETTDEDAEAEKMPIDSTLPVPIEEVFERIGVIEQKDQLPTSLDPSVIAFWLARIMHYLQGMLGGAFLVLLFTIFMLFEAAHFPKKVNRAFGTDGPINFGHFHHIAEEIRRYLFLKTLSNLMSATAAMAVYFAFGVPGALFWGIVAFFMYYIPNLGGTIAAVIPGILIFVAADISTVLLYAVCLLTVECAIAYGIEPKLLGHGLRLSTLVIILSLFFWGFLLGPIGLFLAAPLTVMAKIILQAFPETRWISVFLDGGREK